MKKLILIFIDGIGLGESGNPISGLFQDITGFELTAGGTRYFDNGVLVPADATLDVPGIPQSATGQATIFTGVNASKYLGYHLTALPNQPLVDLINEKSLMKSLKEIGVSVTSANMYSKEFFHKRASRKRNAFPVSTLTIKASGTPFRYLPDYLKGRAVFADIINRLIRERGYDIDIISPEKAASNLVRIQEGSRFVFFEYFMTDIYGHKRNSEGLAESVDILNRFVFSAWEKRESSDQSLLVISDHGNAEDFSTADHTLNRVPALLLSEDEETVQHFAGTVRSLTDIYPWVLEYFSRK